MVDRNFYEILGITRDATAEEVTRAFDALVTLREVVIGNRDELSAMVDIEYAYSVLSNLDLREIYDGSLDLQRLFDIGLTDEGSTTKLEIESITAQQSFPKESPLRDLNVTTRITLENLSASFETRLRTLNATTKLLLESLVQMAEDDSVTSEDYAEKLAEITTRYSTRKEEILKEFDSELNCLAVSYTSAIKDLETTAPIEKSHDDGKNQMGGR